MELFIYIKSVSINTDMEFFTKNESNLIVMDGINLGLKLESLNTVIMQNLIAEHIKDTLPENYAEELLPFDGGIYISHHTEYIESQCCADISNVNNWRELLNASNNNWETLWIGHPQIAVKFVNDKIYFSNYMDEAQSSAFETKFVFDKLAFHTLLSEKLELFESCKQHFYTVIENGNFENKEALKKVLF